MSNVLLIYDEPITGMIFKNFLEVRGHLVQLLKDEQMVKSMIEGTLGNAEVAIIHQDFGGGAKSKLTSNIITDYIHEMAPYIRIGIASGSYPFSNRFVVQCGADFYLSCNDLTGPWCLMQIEKGYVTLDEQANRGIKVEKPVYDYRGGERRY